MEEGCYERCNKCNEFSIKDELRNGGCKTCNPVEEEKIEKKKSEKKGNKRSGRK